MLYDSHTTEALARIESVLKSLYRPVRKAWSDEAREAAAAARAANAKGTHPNTQKERAEMMRSRPNPAQAPSRSENLRASKIADQSSSRAWRGADSNAAYNLHSTAAMNHYEAAQGWHEAGNAEKANDHLQAASLHEHAMDRSS